MLERMTQVRIGIEVVTVAPPFFLVRQVPVGFEIPNDPLSGSLRDPNAGRDVAEPDVGRLGNQDEHSCVVGQKGPGASVFGGQWSTPLVGYPIAFP